MTPNEKFVLAAVFVIAVVALIASLFDRFPESGGDQFPGDGDAQGRWKDTPPS